jgi:hypothetical protein
MFITKKEELQVPAIYLVTINEAIYNKKYHSIRFILTEMETNITIDFIVYLNDKNGNEKKVERMKMLQLANLLGFTDIDPNDNSHFSSIEDKTIGILLTNYMTKDGREYFSCFTWVDPKTKQTFQEKEDLIPAEYVYSKLEELQGNKNE